MNAKEASAALEWVLRRKVIAIVRGQEPEHMVKLACALYEGGVDLIEVTFNQARPETWKDTAAAIEAVCRELADQGASGRGYGDDGRTAFVGRRGGAQNTSLRPIRMLRLSDGSRSWGCSPFPGAMTPSEIAAAYHAGAGRGEGVSSGGSGA